jgi:auxin responsive GH3 family protein
LLDFIQLTILFRNILLQALFTAELRDIGPPGMQGWAVHVWPDLKNFIGITGGPAAASIPRVCQLWNVYYSKQRKVTHILGPSVVMQASCYGSSECYIAMPYFNGDPNTDFKVVPIDGVTEYLDVHSNEPSERVLSAVRILTLPIMDSVGCVRQAHGIHQAWQDMSTA